MGQIERYKRIWKSSYELMAKYNGGVKESDFTDIVDYTNGKCEGDELATDIFKACYKELSRMYGEGKA